ncbi:MAG: hypothetical protein ABIP55_02780 [Tepidisphaeraceae bacterium]
MSNTPSTNGTNGREAGGRFARGNAGGPGNPHAQRIARLRSALFKAVSPADLRDVLAALLKQAKAGDVASIRELLQRLLGPPESVDLMARLDALEATINQLAERRSNHAEANPTT